MDIQVKEEISIEEHHLSESEILELIANDPPTPDVKPLVTFKRNAVRCKICSKPCKDLLQLNEHLGSHAQERLLRETRNKTLKRNDRLVPHGKKPLEGSLYNCNVCRQPFKWASDLRSHSVIHLKKTHTFQNNSLRPLHALGKVRSNQRSLKSDVWKVSFKRKQEFKVNRNVPEKPNQFTCKICKKTFLDLSDLSRHLKYHSEELSHVCDICSLRFKTKGHLTVHRKTHMKQSQNE